MHNIVQIIVLVNLQSVEFKSWWMCLKRSLGQYLAFVIVWFVLCQQYVILWFVLCQPCVILWYKASFPLKNDFDFDSDLLNDLLPYFTLEQHHLFVIFLLICLSVCYFAYSASYIQSKCQPNFNPCANFQWNSSFWGIEQNIVKAIKLPWWTRFSNSLRVIAHMR